MERFYLLKGDKPDTYRVQAVGLSNEERKFIVMTANNNIRLSTTGAFSSSSFFSISPQ
jgi:hypothetical protein